MERRPGWVFGTTQVLVHSASGPEQHLCHSAPTALWGDPGGHGQVQVEGFPRGTSGEGAVWPASWLWVGTVGEPQVAVGPLPPHCGPEAGRAAGRGGRLSDCHTVRLGAPSGSEILQHKCSQGAGDSGATSKSAFEAPDLPSPRTVPGPRQGSDRGQQSGTLSGTSHSWPWIHTPRLSGYFTVKAGLLA